MGEGFPGYRVFTGIPVLATGSYSIQSGSMDLYACSSTNSFVFVFVDRVLGRYADLLECEASVYGAANDAYDQVLLLGGESQTKEWYHS